MQIRLPRTLDKYSVRQAANLLKVLETYPTNPGVDDMVRIVSAVSEIPEKEMRRVDIKPLKLAFSYIIDAANRIQKKPPTEVKLNGTKYVFCADFEADGWSAGRYIDATGHTIDFEDDPEMFVAICYIEEGTVYGDKPLKARAKVMKEHFKGSDFIDLYAFFLTKYAQLKPGFLVLQNARARNELKKAENLMLKDGGRG